MPTQLRWISTSVCVCCVLMLGQAALAENWPQWRGPALDGISPESDWSHEWSADGPRIAWRAEIGIGFSAFAVVGDRAYTMGHTDGQETVYCLNVDTGEVAWSHTYPAELVNDLHDGGPGATPTVHGNHVFTCGKDGHVICFTADEGDVVWESNLQEVAEVEIPEWGFTSSALIHEDEVVIESGRVVALSQETGDVRWRSEPYRPGYGTPTPMSHAGQNYFASLNNDGLVIVGADDGVQVAFHEWETSYATSSTSPIVVENQVFISTGYGRGCSLLGFSGRRLIAAYENTELNNHFNQSILIDGHLYGVHGNSHNPSQCTLRCLDWSTGEVKWIERGFGCGAVTAGGDRLIILSDTGVLSIAEVSPEGYHELARSQVLNNPESVCWTVPVLSGGRIFCRNSHGNAVCGDVRPQ